MARTQARLFLAKVLWKFDVFAVEGQDFDLENDLLHYGFLKNRRCTSDLSLFRDERDNVWTSSVRYAVCELQIMLSNQNVYCIL
jgi:hypothetical protein